MTTQTKVWLPDASRQALIVGHLIVDSLSLSLSPVPTSVHTTLVDPSWCHAMEEKYDAMIANET
jgi:hypothetical protein